jgi:uncharacterized protein YlxP (DUF503 family)
MRKSAIGILNISLYLPGCMSLKEKRGRLRPLMTRLHREFNISVAEIDHQDIWQSALITCVMVSSNMSQTRRNLQQIITWIDNNWPDIDLVDEHIEILS